MKKLIDSVQDEIEYFSDEEEQSDLIKEFCVYGRPENKEIHDVIITGLMIGSKEVQIIDSEQTYELSKHDVIKIEHLERLIEKNKLSPFGWVN